MYGLTIGDSTGAEIAYLQQQGYVALTKLATDKKLRSTITELIKRQVPNVSDIVVEEVFMLLEQELYKHDYNDDRAWNETVCKQMTIDNYILQRATYAIHSYNAKRTEGNKITVVGNGVEHTIYVTTTSLDRQLNTDDDRGGTLQDVVADDSYSIMEHTNIDLSNEDDALNDLVERITRFAERSDSNINVVIYATTCLSLWCDREDTSSTLLKNVFTTLGITNYLSMKEFMHDQEFIDIYQDTANIANKEKFVVKLAKQIYCSKEITTIIRWYADEYNKNLRKEYNL